MDVEKIKSTVKEVKGEIIELCSKLIQIPTPDPPGDTKECVEFIKEYFDQVGIPNKVYTRAEGKYNICARLDGISDRTILFVGHVDVVPEGRREFWKFDPWGGTITEDGRIYGRGATDMKGSCAAAMVAARILHEGKEEIPNNVEFWFTCDEETDCKDGARWLAQEGILKGDVCVIGDSFGSTPTNPIIELGTKGGLMTKLIAKGTTAHGSRPWLGDNAINKLLAVIPYTRRIVEHRLDVPPEMESTIQASIAFLLRSPGLNEEQKAYIRRSYHQPTFSLNITQGGVKSNVVPDYAEAIFDIRLTPRTSGEKARDYMLKLVEESGIKDIKAEINVYPGTFTSPDTSFVKQFSDAVEITLGNRPLPMLGTFGTDAEPIQRISKIPCLGFGAGVSLAQAHAPNEYVTVENLVMATEVYTLFPLVYNGSASSHEGL